MKRILKFISIITFLIIPIQSFAVTTSISDSDLDGIAAQAGSITVRIGQVIVESQNLKNISTDGWNYWDPDHNLTDPHPNNAAGYFDGTSETNPQKYPGAGAYNQAGYVGYDEVYMTGGTIIHSGSMTLEVVSTSDPNVKSGSKMDVVMNNNSVYAPISVEAVIKLSPSPDLAGGQSLGRVYTGGISSTTNGHLTVYAHNNTLML
jgi:hypothetical protein